MEEFSFSLPTFDVSDPHTQQEVQLLYMSSHVGLHLLDILFHNVLRV